MPSASRLPAGPRQSYSASSSPKLHRRAPMGQRRLLALVLLLFMPAFAFAQEATVIGTVTDSTGGVLPGVTVRAIHDATGNTFETVTDDRGNFRIPARTGAYRIVAELQG